MEKLKLCPFCGGEASCNNRGLNDKDGNPVWWAECLSCGASIEGTENTKGAAMAAWNKRAQDTEAKRRRTEQNPKPLTLDELIRMDGEPVWVMVVDHKVFADKDDDFDGWGMCRKSWARLWDKERADLIHVDYDFEDYGKKWLAYRTKPEGRGKWADQK